MNLRNLANKAKELVDKRGGTDALKQDADELKRIAQSEGSLTDKAKDAADALKEPGTGAAAPDEAPAQAPEGRGGGGERGKPGGGGGRGKRDGGGARHEGKGRDRL